MEINLIWINARGTKLLSSDTKIYQNVSSTVGAVLLERHDSTVSMPEVGLGYSVETATEWFLSI